MIENTKGDWGVDFIMGFSHLGKRVSDLSRIKDLLNTLGNPQDKLKFIHIAGTNGKGSTAQMFNEICIQAGLKTGLFTSPYLIEYSDRIKINNENIPYERLNEIALRVKDKVEKSPYRGDFSQFEITTAIAFLYFLEENCDIVVLETGLGGLLDCTNVVNTTILSVICSVDFDHTAVLGNTLEEISYQKAGIIKPEIPCILNAGNDDAVVNTVRQTAEKNHSPLIIPDIPLMKLNKCDFFGSDFEYKNESYQLSMGGEHQVLNAMSVIEGCKILPLDISHDAVKKGLKKAVLTGRIEVISKEPLTILDGAHNPDGLSALAEVLKSCKKSPCKAVIGMCADKNIAEGVCKLIPYVDEFIAVDGFYDRAVNKETLAEIICQNGGKAIVSEKSIIEEINKIQTENPDGINLVCGSLFLVSYVKSN
ncbi:MAG: bifunctional folylpolyglutamate synthase/dihydrofolate synthase [Hominimerdicola sp.]